ncbi:cytochrome P450 [Lentzea atacamensis]|uniref:Cytochrome P450 n=1 Tax=Lentzea atacamensis TaxID=531938 RepID=A0ABX9DZB5_9PSEU|nr:cytochrome P450 [Lentzea atacamensis]RAS59451.1 cytochrome P450 [Lentzea atacamensis]
MPSPDTLVTGQCGYRHHADERELREVGTVHRAKVPDGPTVYVVTTGLKQAKRLLADPRLSKDSGRLTEVITRQLAAAGTPRELSGMFSETMMNADPPQHTRLRNLVVKSFNADGVNRLRPRAEQLTAELLDTLPTGVPIDLISRFAFILPITIVCEMLGVPEQDRGMLHTWTSALVLDDPALTGPASIEMTRYLEQLADSKRATPDDGLCSMLVHASVDDDKLSRDELIAMLFLLVVGGHETTAGLIGNAMYALLADPPQWRRLVEDPALVPAAVEETLRFDPPTRNATHRVTLQDIEVDGTPIAAGEIVLVSLSAAGHDPDTTDRADEFDLGRSAPIQHVGFGHGIHNCPGSQLARMQAEVALAQLAARFPHSVLVEREPPRLASSIVGGVAELRLVLS